MSDPVTPRLAATLMLAATFLAWAKARPLPASEPRTA